MCGRFTQLYSWPELVALCPLTMPPVNLQPSYNICPTDPVDVLLPKEGGGLDFVRMRWRLVPYWWSKPLKQLPATFNARSDAAIAAGAATGVTAAAPAARGMSSGADSYFVDSFARPIRRPAATMPRREAKWSGYSPPA